MLMRKRGRIYILLAIGATLLITLAVMEYAFTISSLSEILQPSVSAGYEVAQLSFQEIWNLSFINTGNVSVQIPPEMVPVINVSGVLFPTGAPAVLGTAATERGSLAVSLPGGGPAPPCQSNLSLTRTPYPGTSAFNVTFYQASGLDVFGPTSISLILAGTSSWPSMGIGVLLPDSLSTLVVIQVARGGQSSAWVSYYHYVTYGNYTLVARSAPFPFNSTEPSLLTVSLAPDGAMSASVNGGLRLSSQVPMLNPSGGPFAVVLPTLSSLLGIFATSAGSFAFLSPPHSCQTMTLVPFASNLRGGSPPSAPAGYHLVKPMEVSGDYAGTFYMLERAVPGTQPATSLSLSNALPITLGIGQSLSLVVPLGP